MHILNKNINSLIMIKTYVLNNLLIKSSKFKILLKTNRLIIVKIIVFIMFKKRLIKLK